MIAEAHLAELRGVQQTQEKRARQKEESLKYACFFNTTHMPLPRPRLFGLYCLKYLSKLGTTQHVSILCMCAHLGTNATHLRKFRFVNVLFALVLFGSHKYRHFIGGSAIAAFNKSVFTTPTQNTILVLMSFCSVFTNTPMT